MLHTHWAGGRLFTSTESTFKLCDFFKMLLVFILFAVTAPSFAIGHEDNNILKVPIVHTESALEKLLRTGASLSLIEGIYNMSRQGARPMFKDGKPVPTDDTLNLFKYFQSNYYGIVNFGKPGRPFKMALDTAWSFTWVISRDCPHSLVQCVHHNKYDHTISSTYKEDGTPFNSSGKYVGYFSYDVIHAGHLNASNQSFIEITRLPFPYVFYATDGIIGLALKKLTPNYNQPFFYNFAEQNNLKKIFSIYINRDPTTNRGGSVYFGGIDYTHNKSAFTEVDVTGPGFWEFNMTKISLVISKKQKYDFCVNGCKAIADSSTNTISGPKDEVYKINQMIGADQYFYGDHYMIPCVNQYKGYKIAFTIGNREFLIKPQNYIQVLAYSGLQICLSAFVPDTDHLLPNNTWTLGGAFLYQYYTAFDIDNNKIMFADVS